MNAWTQMRDRVEDYLTARRRLGYVLQVEGQELHRFARFAEAQGHRGPVTVSLALAWASACEHGAALYRARRLEIVRGLARYCVAFEPDTQVPPQRLLGPAHRRTNPHIYTDQEIHDLLAAADGLSPRGGLRPASMRFLLGLLAATGLRVSEALRLARGDVDLTRAVLTVRETKFRKSRYVPVHPTAAAALTQYANFRDRRIPLPRETAFFLSDTGRAFPYRHALYAFQRLRHRLGWDHRPGPRPRLYDLRHTFACRRLLAWYEEGIDVHRILPLLTTYLGHAKVTDTYWYLTGLPALMAVAGERFEQWASQDREDGHA